MDPTVESVLRDLGHTDLGQTLRDRLAKSQAPIRIPWWRITTAIATIAVATLAALALWGAS